MNFKVTIKEVKEITLPELNDDFAKTVAPDFKTVDDLKKDIERELIARADQQTNQSFQDSLLEELTEKSKVPTPEVLVKDQLTALEQQFTQNLAYRGLTLDKYLEEEKLNREEWVAKELRPAAEKRVRNSLVMAQLTRDWDISVSEEEVDAQQARILMQYNDPSLKARFESPEAKQQIAQQLMAEKTLNKLAQTVTK